MSRTASIRLQAASATRQTAYQTKVAAELWLNLGGKEFRLVGKSVRIGRAEDNDIVADDKSCSRYHALITIAGDQVIIEDLKSRNGVRVNGAQVRRSELKDGDQIRVGDLNGLYFLKVKSNKPKAHEVFLSKISEKGFEQFTPYVESLKSKINFEKFQALDKPKKMMVVVGGILGLFLVWNVLMSGSGSRVAEMASTTSGTKVVQTPVDHREFEKCLELEDLGNYRQASTCLKKLPFTVDVQSSLERVQAHAADLAERRYKEGQQAFENYYYDIAIQKWQEVMLVADDNSDFRFHASKGIRDAEDRKKLR